MVIDNPILDGVIKRNAARCRVCGDVVESTHAHDYRTCRCGRIAVDGGTRGLQRQGNASDIEEMSVVEPPTVALVKGRLALQRFTPAVWIIEAEAWIVEQDGKL